MTHLQYYIRLNLTTLGRWVSAYFPRKSKILTAILLVHLDLINHFRSVMKTVMGSRVDYPLFFWRTQDTNSNSDRKLRTSRGHPTQLASQ